MTHPLLHEADITEAIGIAAGREQSRQPNHDQMNGGRERLPGADYEAPGADDRQKSTSEPALPFINIAAWQNTPAPEREWAVRDRVPLKNVTLLSGEGGVGKSILALHLAVGTTLGRDWLGSMPMPGPVLVLCCEDDEHELRRRLDQIVAHYGASHEELSTALHAVSLAGQDAVMAAPDKHGLIMPTPLFARLRQAVRDIRPRLIVIDNSADVFAGNENDRAQVRQFITLLRGIAIDANAGLLLTSHPSLTGISSGSGLSGSTAWNASVRSRLYFRRAKTDKDEEPDPDLRVLELMKSNYGPTGETITLRWKAGLFLPVAGTGGLDKLAAEQAAEQLFLTLLDRFNGQGRNSSEKPNAPTYAPTMFAKEHEAKEQAIRKADLEVAMRRLFAADKIWLEPYGAPSKATTRLKVRS
jgi:RecA-family ATPase